MKTLTLIRHAKSSWDDETWADRERPLAKRGRRDLVQMAAHLGGLREDWGCVVSSPARRAVETAEGLYEAGVFGDRETSIDEACYTFDAESLAAWVRGRADALTAVTAIGHNPAIHELVNTWYDPGIPRVPTLAVIRLLSDAEGWRDFTCGEVRLGAYLYPGMFRS